MSYVIKRVLGGTVRDLQFTHRWACTQSFCHQNVPGGGSALPFHTPNVWVLNLLCHCDWLENPTAIPDPRALAITQLQLRILTFSVRVYTCLQKHHLFKDSSRLGSVASDRDCIAFLRTSISFSWESRFQGPYTSCALLSGTRTATSSCSELKQDLTASLSLVAPTLQLRVPEKGPSRCCWDRSPTSKF